MISSLLNVLHNWLTFTYKLLNKYIIWKHFSSGIYPQIWIIAFLRYWWFSQLSSLKKGLHIFVKDIFRSIVIIYIYIYVYKHIDMLSRDTYRLLLCTGVYAGVYWSTHCNEIISCSLAGLMAIFCRKACRTIAHWLSINSGLKAFSANKANCGQAFPGSNLAVDFRYCFTFKHTINLK